MIGQILALGLWFFLVWFSSGAKISMGYQKKNPHSTSGDKAKQLPSVPQFQINSG